MARQKMPDRLTQEVSMAIAASMSYGKWKAMQQPVKVEEKPIPKGWKKCEYCGKPFKPKCSQKFCDMYCREQAYKPRRNEILRESARKYRERKGMTEDV